tara:strand:- start:2055 stop:2237 length:183 start_codon:yes stop_codon:yes gene_type:complete
MKIPSLCVRTVVVVLVCGLTACVGTIIETTTDAALAVAKVPFKTGGAIVDVISDDEDDDE